MYSSMHHYMYKISTAVTDSVNDNRNTYSISKNKFNENINFDEVPAKFFI